MQRRWVPPFRFEHAPTARERDGRRLVAPGNVRGRVACAILLAAGCAGRARQIATDGAEPAGLEASGSGATSERASPPRSAPESAASRPRLTPIDGYPGATPSSGDGVTSAAPDLDLDQLCAASRQPRETPDAGTDGGTADGVTPGGGPGDAGAPSSPARDEPYCNYDPDLCKLCLDDQCGDTLAACERGNDSACLSATDCRNSQCNGVCIEAQDDGYDCGGFVTSTWTPCDAAKKNRIPPRSDQPYCHYDPELCIDCLADECAEAVGGCELAGDPLCQRPCDTGLEPSCSFTGCRNSFCPAVCVDARQDGYLCEDGATQTWRPGSVSE